MDVATERAPGAAPEVAPRALPHILGFEGLRGIGLLVMLLYHGGYTGIKGAIFSVSMFFTLSGYLITALLRDERHRTHGTSFRRFWVGRARRLLPAGLLTLIGILVFHSAFGGIAPHRLRGDVLAALGYVENLWLIQTHQAYGAVFGESSPVQNFWSLAIEEQFYLLLPLVWVGLHLVFRRSRSIALVFAVGAIASFGLAAAMSSSWGLTRTYFGTDTRVGEILVGVALAHVVTGHRLDLSERGRRTLNLLACVAVGVLAVLWWRVGLNDWFTFHGGTAVNAVGTSVIILACLQAGMVTSVMCLRPFRWLGRVSYGIYLVHWPVFLWLNPTRLHLEKAPLFVVRMAVTLTIAAVVYRFVELPIRHRRMLPGGRFAVAVASATAAIIVGSLLLSGSTGNAVDLSSPPAANSQLDGLAAASAHPTKMRVLVVGDSVSWSMSVGLQEWGARHDVDVAHYFSVACGIGGPGMLRYLGIVRSPPPDCGLWHRSLSAAVAKFRPDIALVVMGLGDLSPRRFADGHFLSIGNPKFDRFLRAHIAKVTRDLGSSGARVVWVTYPYSKVHFIAGATGQPPFPENERARMDKLNAMIENVTRQIPGTSIVDFAGYSHNRPGGELDPAYRPDGVHLVPGSTQEVATWLGPQLQALR